jgi:hypothetical protein
MISVGAAEALTTLKDYYFPANKTRLLDVYAPMWRELNQDPAFRSVFRPAWTFALSTPPSQEKCLGA